MVKWTPRTGVLGGPPVTAFASIINTGSQTATGCSIALPGGVPAVLHYQRTDSQNMPIGSPDVPVDIAAGGHNALCSPSTASAAFSQDIALVFICTNSNPAPSFCGVNTFSGKHARGCRSGSGWNLKAA